MSPGDPAQVDNDARSPAADNDSRQFWTAATEGRLEVPYCQACARFVFYPRSVCPACLGSNLPWREASRRGRVYSHTVSRRPASPEFAGLDPLRVVLVDMDDGFRVMSNVLDPESTPVGCGTQVEMVFESWGGGPVLPYFRVSPAV